MITLEKYLDNFNNSRQITLVGPLFERGEAMPDLAEPLIFVDGGARLRQCEEGVVVGDGDSFAGTMDVLLATDKSFSDLAFALSNIPQHFGNVRLLGFLGGRRDHELFNIGEAHHFLCNRKQPTTITFDNDIIGYSSGQWQFERIGSFSVAVVEAAHISLRGACRYTCPPTTRFMPLRSLGLSNIGTGTVYIDCDNPIFVLFENLSGRLSENIPI